ncbi:MAG TPA: transposase [Longimicrobiales bacterium]|nr:transposase [Longimicrobiales bacterium]
MDEELSRFRAGAARENRGRRAIRRRYSPGLQHQAVAYCVRRQHEGARVRAIAAALGVAPWSLHRWMRQVQRRRAFRPIELGEAAPPSTPATVVITFTAAGPRVEGLTVETAAQLLARLR